MFYEDAADYQAYLPSKIGGAEEARAIAESVNQQVDLLNGFIKKMVDNKSVLRSDAQGLERWEDILGITPTFDASLEQRRDAIKSQLMSKPPINVKRLEEIVAAYIGAPVEAKVDGYMLTIWYKGVDIGGMQAPLQREVEKLIPANLVLRILYNYIRWGAVKPLTWGEARQRTWNLIRMEGE